MGTSVLPVLLINRIADIHEEVLAEYWREKKSGMVTMNCELKCYLLSKAELLKSSITLVMNE